MRTQTTLHIPAELFADCDDSLTAAANAVAAKLDLERWELSPRWANDQRDEILLDVPVLFWIT